MAIVEGTIGSGMAYKFKGFTDLFGKLPSFEQIIKNPTKIDIPDEPSINYALSALLGEKVTEKVIEPAMQFINRLPAEFQVITLKSVLARNKALLSNTHTQTWIKNNAKVLL